MGNIKAVIFDLDGTLIDTEKYYRICWPAAFQHFGLHISDEQELMLRSLGKPFCSELMAEWFGPDFDLSPIRKYRTYLLNNMIAEKGIDLKPGVISLLEFLKNSDIVAAIATASDYDRAIEKLNKVGLLPYFDTVIGASMVEHGKPGPDIYQYACQQLDFKPEECFAVEDSPNGVKSAYSAGCKVIMVPDLTDATEDLIPMIYKKLYRIDEIIDLLSVNCE